MEGVFFLPRLESGLAVEVSGRLGCEVDSNDLSALWVSCRALLASAGGPLDLSY